MPYSSTNDLPESIKSKLPKKAQEMFVATFNSAAEQGHDEQTCFKIAWAAVKRKYKKEGDRWVAKSDLIKAESSILKVDSVKRLVKGAVYVPYLVDSQGDWADPETIEKMAHNFLAELNAQNVDTQHDLRKNGCVVVESYIAQENDPDGFIPGSWIVVTKINDDEIWDKIVKGELRAYSMYGKGIREEGVDPPVEVNQVG